MRDANNTALTINFLTPSWAGFAVLCGLAAFLTFTGVYNAVETLPFWLGWCYWMLTLLVGCLAAFLAIATLRKMKAHIFAQIAASMVVSTAAVTSVIVLLQYLSGHVVPWSFIPFLFGQVLVISVLIFTIGFISERALLGKTETEAETRNPTKHFLENLPIKYREAELYAISSEDHYLRVYTNKGEELILMRLADAVHNLKDANGLQTHRSWWVAEAGLSDVTKENGQTKLVLKSGITVPVSRTYQAAVKAAGWF